MRRKKRTRKITSFLLFLCLFIIAVIIGYFVYQAYFDGHSSQVSEHDTTTTVEPQSSSPITPSDPIPPETPVEPSKTPVQYDGANPNANSNLTGAITYASKNSNNLTVRINIDQYVTSGTCELDLLQNGASVYHSSARLFDNASTSTCEGFDIPATNLSGNYKIVINLSSDGKTGQVTKEVQL